MSVLRRACVAGLLAGAIALLPATARADGDPASDVLLGQKVFYPYDSKLSSSWIVQLKKTVDEATARGFPIRVAVIASPTDLGSAGVLWGKPQTYAGFLAYELSLAYKGPLLIAMPTGLGYVVAAKPVPSSKAVLGRVQIRQGADGLMETADDAARALAAAAGHTLPVGRASSGAGSSSGRDTILIAVAAAAAIGLLAAALGLLRRVRRRPPPGSNVDSERSGRT